MKKLIVVLITLGAVENACCFRNDRVEPVFPSITSGWKQTDRGGVHILGEFVLKLNEATDNGKIKVEVIGLVPGDACAEFGSYARQDKIKLRFINSVNQAVLCESVFITGGSTTLFSGPCREVASKFDVAAVYVKAINIKDGWVHFDLAK